MQRAAPRPTVGSATNVLQETFDALCSAPQIDVAARRVVRFRLSRYFSIVELDDGSVGSCMSYSAATDSAIEAQTELLQRGLATDPLWQTAMRAAQADPLLLSARASLISALSAPILNSGGDSTVLASRAALWDPLAGAGSALVIGFGGYMHSFALDPRVERMHVADLGYQSRRAEMDQVIEGYRRARPSVELTISDGHDTAAQARDAEVIAITGSALCNGSMEQLLSWAQGRRVIVQGQSAAIYPAALFARGVAMVATTLKPRNLIDVADRGGLPGLLEGGLPWIYLYSYAQLGEQLAPAASLPAR
jgi:hypothetical protein